MSPTNIQQPQSLYSDYKLALPSSIAVAVDLSDESAYAVRWTVENYIRPGDAVIILHVSPTSGLLGADWGPLNLSSPSPSSSSSSSDHHGNKHKHNNSNSSSSSCVNNTNNNGDEDQLLKKQQEDFDAFTAAKVADFAKPLKQGTDGTLGSVSNYCLNHCVCPVVVVRDEKDGLREGEESAKPDNSKGQGNLSSSFIPLHTEAHVLKVHDYLFRIIQNNIDEVQESLAVLWMWGLRPATAAGPPIVSQFILGGREKKDDLEAIQTCGYQALLSNLSRCP
ncbi:hypothetical protein ACFE04_007207 [Oxalis oulophora]